MNKISLIKYILSHPLNQNNKLKAIFRVIKWQINKRINPYPIIYPFIANAKLIIQKDTTSQIANIYCGLADFNDMGFLLHFLREEDLFVDIGANIGSYTILASCGAKAKVFSIEPVPSTFSQLVDNISINKIADKVSAFNVALGFKEGYINFTSELGSGNHVARKDEAKVIKVPVDTLDRILQNQKIPSLLKIDVEGYETEVINGATKTLPQEELKAIIIELNGLSSRYDYDQELIHKKLIDLHFKPFQYNPCKRELIAINKFGNRNTIYIRDVNFVHERLKTAPKIKILNNEI